MWSKKIFYFFKKNFFWDTVGVTQLNKYGALPVCCFITLDTLNKELFMNDVVVYFKLDPMRLRVEQVRSG